MAPLEKAYLPGVNLKGADLWKANFKCANLGWATPFRGYVVLKQQIDFWGDKLMGQVANLGGANLSEANFEGADLWRANLAGASLAGASLAGASLAGAKFMEANLYGANLFHANLQGADLQGAILRKADFSSASLAGANLVLASLQGADLFLANLQSADLRGADLKNAQRLTQKQLDTANGDNRTVLTAGLTRPAHWSKVEANEGPPTAHPDDAGRDPAADCTAGSDK